MANPIVDVSESCVTITGAHPVLTYNLMSPADSNLPMETGGYFHPICTPAGVCVTDFAPEDHRHHRGLFFAWVEMHGEADGDFWGWGQCAPIDGRKIVNRRISSTPTGFVAENEWMAGDFPLMAERLAISVEISDSTMINLVYRFTPPAEVRLEQWAFSGFCLRLRKDAEAQYFGSDELVELENPVYTDPASDWPDARWYGVQLTLGDGSLISAAVENLPGNPPTLWHNHREARMLNPCTIAPGSVVFPAGKEQVFRYRVALFDGPLRPKVFDR